MKRKINIGRPPLSPQEIARYKNFNTVLAQYRKTGKPIFRKPWFYGNVFLVTVAALALIMQLDKPEQNPSSESSSRQTSFINPPIKGFNIDYSNYIVNSSKGRELIYKTGSKIIIPNDAFVDENNRPVDGDIEIRYREFHDAVDFFVSGIPMTYDSAGVKYHFESAGMMEILAFKNGKPIFMHPEKKIQVEMASKFTGTNYNLYYLDSSKKNWQCEGKDMVIPAIEKDMQTFEQADRSDTLSPKEKTEHEVKQVEQKMEKIKSDIAELKRTIPVEPKKMDKKRYTFNIEVDPKEFPELAVYKNAQFEVGEENKNFSSKMYKITWESASLSEKVKGKSYNLTLTKGTEKHDFIVYPVYDGKSYEDAMKIYKNKFEEYQVKLKERQELEEKLRLEYEAKVKKMQEESAARQKQWEEEQKRWRKEQETRIAAVKNEYEVQRIFQINRFGIWNCDQPQMLPKERVIAARFFDENEKNLNLSHVYLVEKNRNAIFTYYNNKFNHFQFNPSAKNMVWAVTPENELAVCSYDDFALIPASQGVFNFRMKTIKYEFKSVDELKKILNIES